jgi:hypothetical protein
MSVIRKSTDVGLTYAERKSLRETEAQEAKVGLQGKGNDRSLRLNSDRPTKRKPPEGGLFSSLSVSDRGQNQSTQSAPVWPHILVDTARVFTVVIRASPP